jgi:hypothetical protein
MFDFPLARLQRKQDTFAEHAFPGTYFSGIEVESVQMGFYGETMGVSVNHQIRVGSHIVWPMHQFDANVPDL